MNNDGPTAWKMEKVLTLNSESSLCGLIGTQSGPHAAIKVRLWLDYYNIISGVYLCFLEKPIAKYLDYPMMVYDVGTCKAI
jgi:hypothetical protein